MYLLEFNWNPLTGIDIVGNFKIHFYSLMWVAAFIIGWNIMKRIFNRENVKIEYLDPLFIYTVLATMLGARLGHVIFYQPELFSRDFFSVFLPFNFVPKFEFSGFSGLASHGAAIGIVFSMYLYRKKYKYNSLMWILDRIVIPVASGAVFIRIGNFINSEIIGKESGDFPLGVRFIQEYYRKGEIVKLTGIKDYKEAYQAVSNNPKFIDLLNAVPYRHAAQLYEAFCYIFVFLILLYFYLKTNKGNQPGFIFGLFLVLLWTVRFFVEFFKIAQVDGRDDYIWFMNTGQALSIPFIIIGIYFMFFFKQKSNYKS
ncbi:prolipoprotein diacylglyceryl transferase [Lacinutrix sp.]|uniref:prolipoprotein diacylglyceryl transferase n=1 Tax=Lacinutrix sp. TaxID=1937692 RepID=UPI0025BF0FD5|nr:prolipoprotein diacylglyceryl transferase [Lacinutrix sp.]